MLCENNAVGILHHKLVLTSVMRKQEIPITVALILKDFQMGQDDRQIKINHLFKCVVHISFLAVYVACFCV